MERIEGQRPSRHHVPATMTVLGRPEPMLYAPQLPTPLLVMVLRTVSRISTSWEQPPAHVGGGLQLLGVFLAYYNVAHIHRHMARTHKP